MTAGCPILFGLLLSVHVVCGTVISCSITDTRTGQIVITQAGDPLCSTGVPNSGLTERGFSILQAPAGLSLPAFFTAIGNLDTFFGDAVYGTPADLCDGEPCDAFIFKWSARRTAMRRLRTEITNDSGLGHLDAFIDIEATDSVPTPCRYSPSASISVKQGNGPFVQVGRTVSLNYNQPFDIMMNLDLSLDCEMRFSSAEGVTGAISRLLSVEISSGDNPARMLYLVDVEIPEPATATLISVAIAGFLVVHSVRRANSAIWKRAC